LPIYTKIKRQFYQDSLKLMRVSAEVKEMEGVKQAFAFMATEINKKTRMQAGLISDEVMAAGADDLILLVKSENEALATVALDAFETKISAANTAKDTGKAGRIAPATFEEGYAELPANLAVISVPGPYAALQTMRALQTGMNVQLFSDNVTIEEEIAIKDLAKEKNLLVMGPDCGTSIISGIPICFANKVRSGNIGVVGASGTGLQEFTVLLDAAGCGITHAIGTGGRDLSEAVAGRTALAALELLADDAGTDIIAVISKPPAKSAADKIIEAIRRIGKPAVLAFLGQKSEKLSDELYVAGTVEEAAAKAVALCRSQNAEKASVLYVREPLDSALLGEIKKLTGEQKQVKGLYTGGTLASEAKFVLKDCDHSVIDLGGDEYTRGSVHPMIDPSNRTEHIFNAFADPRTAVLLCDTVIGFGSHKDPAGLLAKAIEDARKKTGTHVIAIASVTGTDADPQNRSEQVKKLETAGVWVFPSNQYAAEAAAQIAQIIRKGANGNEQ
jgi:FdrA protein